MLFIFMLSSFGIILCCSLLSFVVWLPFGSLIWVLFSAYTPYWRVFGSVSHHDLNFWIMTNYLLEGFGECVSSWLQLLDHDKLVLLEEKTLDLTYEQHSVHQQSYQSWNFFILNSSRFSYILKPNYKRLRIISKKAQD